MQGQARGNTIQLQKGMPHVLVRVSREDKAGCWTNKFIMQVFSSDPDLHSSVSSPDAGVCVSVIQVAHHYLAVLRGVRSIAGRSPRRTCHFVANCTFHCMPPDQPSADHLAANGTVPSGTSSCSGQDAMQRTDERDRPVSLMMRAVLTTWAFPISISIFISIVFVF